MQRRPFARYAQPPMPHEVLAARAFPTRFVFIWVSDWLTCAQVCCAAGIKQSLLQACESYKAARQSSGGGSSGGGGAIYSAFANDALCILQDLIVQHLQVSHHVPVSPLSSHRSQSSCLFVYACDCLCRVSLQVRPCALGASAAAAAAPFAL